MNICISEETGDIIRIEEKGGAGCTIDISDKKSARIIFLFVPEEQRRQGIGRALLVQAAGESARMGKSTLFCEFSSDLKPFHSLLASLDYSFSERDGIFSVKTDELLSSTGVKNSLRMKFPSIDIEPVDSLLSFQWDEVMEFLSHFGFDPGEDSYDRIETSLSFSAYDEKGKLRAVLLASEIKEGLIVELLLGYSKNAPQYILAVCQELARSLSYDQLAKQYPKITMLSANKGVLPLLKRVLDRRFSINEEAVVLHAEIDLRDDDAAPVLQSANIDTDKWQEEIRLCPYQRNINEKYMWVNRDKMKGR